MRCNTLSVLSDNVSESIVYSACPSVVFVCSSVHWLLHSFIRSFVHSVLTDLVMNCLNNLDKTYSEYSLTPDDDLV